MYIFLFLTRVKVHLF